MLLAARVRALSLLATALLGSCSLHSKAVQWHGHVGPDGVPVFVQQSTYIGLQLAVFVPFLGNTNIGEMIDESSASIDCAEGSRLRLIETETNYWYGVPPLSWFVTPVVSSVTFEYQPSAQALAREGVSASTQAPATPNR